MIVADCNLIAYLHIEGKFTKQAELIFDCDPEWVVPYLWRSEFSNILATYVKQGIITLDKAIANFNTAQAHLAEKEFEINSISALELSASSGLSAYDSEYVILAQKLALKLVTNDKKILKTFPDLAIKI